MIFDYMPEDMSYLFFVFFFKAVIKVWIMFSRRTVLKWECSGMERSRSQVVAVWQVLRRCCVLMKCDTDVQAGTPFPFPPKTGTCLFLCSVQKAFLLNSTAVAVWASLAVVFEALQNPSDLIKYLIHFASLLKILPEWLKVSVRTMRMCGVFANLYSIF